MRVLVHCQSGLSASCLQTLTWDLTGPRPTCSRMGSIQTSSAADQQLTTQHRYVGPLLRRNGSRMISQSGRCELCPGLLHFLFDSPTSISHPCSRTDRVDHTSYIHDLAYPSRDDVHMYDVLLGDYPCLFALALLVLGLRQLHLLLSVKFHCAFFISNVDMASSNL